MSSGISLVIPVHPPRFHTTLDRALRSVWEQTLVPDNVIVSVDHDHAGAAATRNRGLLQVTTEFTAFLDSDDQLMPNHLDALAQHQRETGADLVFPYGTVVGGWDPFQAYEGKPFDPKELEAFNRIPVTVLARTSLLVEAGGFQALNFSTEPGASPCEDHGAWRALVAAGGTISHLNLRTWYWHMHRSENDGNTSGRGDRW